MKTSVSPRQVPPALAAAASQAHSGPEEFARYRSAMNRLNSILDGDRPEEEALKECVEAVRYELDADRCLLAFPCDPDSETHIAPICAERPGSRLPPLPRAIPVSAAPVRAFLSAFADAQEPLALGPSDATGFDPGFLDRNRIGARLLIPVRPKSGQAWWLALHDCDRDRVWTAAEKRLFQDMAMRIKPGLAALLMTRSLRRNQAFGNLLTEMLPQLLWTSDAGGKTDFVNRRMREFTGLEDLDRLGRAEHIHPEDMAAERARLAECIRDCALYEGEMRIRRRDGEYVWHLVRSAPLLNAQGKVERRVGTCTDISESKRLLNALARSKEELEAIIGGVGEGISAQDATGRLIYANRKYAEISGYPSPEALLAAPLQERVERFRIFDEEGRPVEFDRVPGRRVLRGESQASLIMRFADLALGRERWVHAKSTAVTDADGRISMAINFSQDITELKEKEETVRRLRKMESLGKLAGGIAHDFNNLLVSINGYSDLGARIAEAGDPVLHGYFAAIRESGERAAALVQQLLAYGRKQMVQPRALDLNAIVSGMRPRLQRMMGAGAGLKIALADGLPPVKADPGQMEQVVMNLVLNARDAMPAGGVVRLETAVGQVEEGHPPGREDVRPGRYAILLVADTGPGIDPAFRDRIFEPFFTAGEGSDGPAGRSGTGLGLASAYSIVDQWGGHIRVESEAGKGSVFRILLPAMDPGPPESAPASSRVEPSAAPEKGTILLAEDAEPVILYARHVLETEGFSVLTARSGAEALGQAERAARLDLLLVDVALPDMRGSELLARIRAARPELKAVLMSGYRGPDGSGAEEAGRTEYLWKPFAPEQLAVKARRLLGRGAG